MRTRLGSVRGREYNTSWSAPRRAWRFYSGAVIEDGAVSDDLIKDCDDGLCVFFFVHVRDSLSVCI